VPRFLWFITHLITCEHVAFWESTDEPSLKNFLDFRLSSGDLAELSEISKFYSEVSEIGQKVLRWKNAFKESKVYYFRLGSRVHQLPYNLRGCSGNDCVSVGELYSTNHLETLSTIEYTDYSTTCAVVVGTTACLLVSYTQRTLGSMVLAKDSYSIIEYSLGAWSFVMSLILVCM